MNRLVAYIRIPKTGSSSVIHGLESRGIPPQNFATTTPDKLWVINNEQVNFLKHEYLANHYVFTTIRNPLTRFISGWRFCRQVGWLPEDVTPIELLNTIKKGEKLPREVFFHVAMPQSRWLFSQSKLLCDNILKFETLNYDARYLMKHLGVPGFQIPHLKNSRQKNPETNEFYLVKFPRLRQMHYEVFKEDWRRLPYEK